MAPLVVVEEGVVGVRRRRANIAVVSPRPGIITLARAAIRPGVIMLRCSISPITFNYSERKGDLAASNAA
jgi:predicted peroxiredoxin